MLVKKRPCCRAGVSQICPFVGRQKIERRRLEFFVQKAAPRRVVKTESGVRQRVVVQKKQFRFLAKREPERGRVGQFRLKILRHGIGARLGLLREIEGRAAPVAGRALGCQFPQKEEKKGSCQHRLERNERRAGCRSLVVFVF